MNKAVVVDFHMQGAQQPRNLGEWLPTVQPPVTSHTLACTPGTRPARRRHG